MATELAIVGNVSLDRIQLSSSAHASAAVVGGAALNIAAGYGYWGGCATLIAHLGPNIPSLERYSAFINTDYCDRSEQPSPEFLLEYDAAHALCGIAYDENSIAASKLSVVASRPRRGAWVHLSLRKPYGVADAAALVAAGFRLSIDVIVSSVGEQADGLAGLLPHLEIIFCNADEWKQLQSILPTEHAQLALVTAGLAPLEVWRFGQVHSAHEVVAAHVVDPTGAGDAFTGGFLRGHLSGLDLDTSIALGMHAASRAISDFGVLHILSEGHD